MRHSGRLASLTALGLLASGVTHAAGTAALTLVSSSAQVVQTSDTEWLLEKAGALNGNTVTWVIAATEQQTVAGQLLVQGHLTVTNTGTGPATIGNIVVNLQTRTGNKWVTRSSDIANATDGDAATTASLHQQASSEGLASFTENAASGELEFMDATNNTAFSLVPQVLIPTGGSRALLFQAAFDNNVLNLPTGTQIRAETIVSFGNATVGGNSTANVDINGNGTIDADEARIRSVATRLTLRVPASLPGNSSPTLSDTLDDIAATGDVTFSNVQINLAPTSGTVSALVNGGTNGGTITNCAHLTSPDRTVTSGGFTFPVIDGVDLQACSTVTVGGTPTCTPGTPGCGWSVGDVVTYAHGQWGTPGTTAAGLLNNSFGTVYFAAPGGVLEVGISGSSGYSIQFSSGAAVQTFLPTAGTPAALTADVANPTTTSSGLLGGEITSLALNVDYSATGLLGGSVTTDFGDLSICGANGLPNMTVTSFLSLAENTLGGANTGYSAAFVQSLADLLNTSFQDGTPSTFAQNHLVNGACPSGPWQAGDVVTYGQAQWGTTGTTAASLLSTSYNSVYAATGGALEVGISGTGGFSIRFNSASAVQVYLPSSGIAGPLTGDVSNPTTTSSGILGGTVTALELNVDFSTAGILGGTVAADFGSLSICGAPGLPNMTVADLLAIAESTLGGVNTGYAPAAIVTLGQLVNGAFVDGVPSTFAQDHLVNGACPSGPWQAGDVVTFDQAHWGSTTNPASTLLATNYFTVYPSGVLQLGIPGTTGFSMVFTSATGVINYLPASGTPGPLVSDVLNPTSTSSGMLGGETVGLKLNTDFTSLTGGSAGIDLGGLALCGFPSTSLLNGVSVDSVLADLNSLLGGGSSSTYGELVMTTIASEINTAFLLGQPSPWAQEHLVNGTCP